jgi:hypothetical protein
MRKSKAPAGPVEEHVEKVAGGEGRDDEGRHLSPGSDSGNSLDGRQADRIHINDEDRHLGNQSSRTYRGSNRPTHGGYFERSSGFRSPRRIDDGNGPEEFRSNKYRAPTTHPPRGSLSSEYSRGSQYDLPVREYGGRGRDTMYRGREPEYVERDSVYRGRELDEASRHRGSSYDDFSGSWQSKDRGMNMYDRHYAFTHHGTPRWPTSSLVPFTSCQRLSLLIKKKQRGDDMLSSTRTRSREGKWLT